MSKNKVITKGKKEKAIKVSKITECLSSAAAVILIKNHGLSAESSKMLYKKLKEAGCRCGVFKNTLTKIATNGLSYSHLHDSLCGPILTTYCHDDVLSLVRILMTFCKSEESAQIVSVSLSGVATDISYLEQLSKFASAQELREALVMLLQEPALSLTRILAEPSAMLCRILDKKSEAQLETSA